jgi:hypothetical protein
VGGPSLAAARGRPSLRLEDEGTGLKADSIGPNRGLRRTAQHLAVREVEGRAVQWTHHLVIGDPTPVERAPDVGTGRADREEGPAAIEHRDRLPIRDHADRFPVLRGSHSREHDLRSVGRGHDAPNPPRDISVSTGSTRRRPARRSSRRVIAISRTSLPTPSTFGLPLVGPARTRFFARTRVCPEPREGGPISGRDRHDPRDRRAFRGLNYGAVVRVLRTPIP